MHEWPYCSISLSLFLKLDIFQCTQHFYTHASIHTNPHTLKLKRDLNLTFVLHWSAPHLHVGSQKEGDYCNEELIHHFFFKVTHWATLTRNFQLWQMVKSKFGLQQQQQQRLGCYWRRLGSSREVAFIVVQHVWNHAPVPSAHHVQGSNVALICQVIEEKALK